MDKNTVVELPAAGGEIETLLGVLERNRRTFAWKCGGLDAAGMNISERAARDALAVVSASYEFHGGFRLRTLSA